MRRTQGRVVLAAGLAALAFRGSMAATRDLANVPAFTLTFGRSVLNQLSFDTYRTPFDELQTRPYNMLFANISRQANFGPWPGQQIKVEFPAVAPVFSSSAAGISVK